MTGRPSLLVVLALLVACTQPRSTHRPAPSTLPREWIEQRELTADEQVTHALHRLAFGPRPGDAQRVRQLGVDAWIARQLEPSSIDDRAADELVRRAFPSALSTAAELLRDVPSPTMLRAQVRRNGKAEADDSARIRQAARAAQRMFGDIQGARVARAVASERQLQEVLVDFWLNHFSVFAGKNPQMRYLLADYEREAIRPHVFGRFRDLLGAVAKSPAMLVYLDNWQSVADSGQPTARTLGRRQAARRARLEQARGAVISRRRRGLNENYARELLELHTLGVDGGYTQKDVIEVARAFTGWTIRLPQASGELVFRPEVHDAAAKTVLGHRLPAGRGIEDGEQVLDIVASHPATARHIALKLARRLVSDTPPASLVERAAQQFTRTNGDLRETVRILVASPEFWTRSAFRSKVKSPFELVVSTARALGAPADTTPRTAQAIALLGQPLFGRQSPDGWPEHGAAWMNAGAILNRINFGMAVAGGRLPGTRVENLIPAPELRDAPRERQVDAVIAHLLAGAASPDTRAVLLRGENPLAAADTNASARPRRLAGLHQLVGLALGAPEFQRR